MSNRNQMVLILVAVLGTAGTALGCGADPLRCEARKLRGDSEYFQCVSRCDRRSSREAARLGGARPAAADTDCEDKCAARHDETMQRIAVISPCASEGTPDPATCEARLLRIAANHRICQSRCGRRDRTSESTADCLARCDARCATSVDDTLAQLICGDGRMSEDQVCRAE
ncbi:MAG: hypothetical protein SF182_14490 [Deltaproteobacteria bacterium]|nr:hypothetical protein [Deltaproteobacteria bacterium]